MLVSFNNVVKDHTTPSSLSRSPSLKGFGMIPTLCAALTVGQLSALFSYPALCALHTCTAPHAHAARGFFLLSSFFLFHSIEIDPKEIDLTTTRETGIDLDLDLDLPPDQTCCPDLPPWPTDWPPATRCSTRPPRLSRRRGASQNWPNKYVVRFDLLD